MALKPKPNLYYPEHTSRQSLLNDIKSFIDNHREGVSYSFTMKPSEYYLIAHDIPKLWEDVRIQTKPTRMMSHGFKQYRYKGKWVIITISKY